MEEIRVQFSTSLSGVTEIFSTQIMPLPPLKMMALSLLGEMIHMEEIRVQFSHLFQVGLLKSSQLRISLCRH